MNTDLHRLLIICAVCTICGQAVAVEAHSKIVPMATNMSVLSNIVVSATNSTPFKLPADSDLTFLLSGTAQNSGAGSVSNVTVRLNLGDENKFFTTDLPITLGTLTLRGTTNTVVRTYLNKTNFHGYAWGRVDQVGTSETNNAALQLRMLWVE